MAKKEKEIKTNAVRMVEAKKIVHKIHTYNQEDGMIDGMSVAEKLGQDPDRAFKTLVLVGHSKEHYVCAVPVNCHLDLKKAAKHFGEKNLEMIKSKELLPLTGYIHGGCSPLGMKKLFKTAMNDTAELFDTIYVSGGRIGLQIEINPVELAGLVDAEFVDLTKDE